MGRFRKSQDDVLR